MPQIRVAALLALPGFLSFPGLFAERFADDFPEGLPSSMIKFPSAPWRRLAAVAVLGLALLDVGPAQAQTAVPYYSAGHFVTGLYRDFEQPRAEAFAMSGADLTAALQALCKASPVAADKALADSREQWRKALLAWERQSALAVGPLLTRRSLRAIDFQPMRPRSIERAIASAPQTEAQMVLIGAPAKGFPALEWLLWTKPVAPGTPGCQYAIQLGQEIEREAAALRTDFSALARRDWNSEEEDAAAVAGMTEAISQWVGGIERLRWGRIERPLREASSRGKAPSFVRDASGSDRAAWQADWDSLRSLAIEQAPEVAAPGAGLVPIETFLRGRGALEVADRLRAAVIAADTPMAAIDPSRTDSLNAASAALEKVRRIVEADAAPALQVRIGFSDADGD